MIFSIVDDLDNFFREVNLFDNFVFFSLEIFWFNEGDMVDKYYIRYSNSRC